MFLLMVLPADLIVATGSLPLTMAEYALPSGSHTDAMAGIGVATGFPLSATAAAGRGDRPPAVNVASLQVVGIGAFLLTPPLIGGPPTGRCLILVTPDAQRTMNTCPGASHELAADTISPSLIASASILYLEGYLFGPEKPRAAMMKAVDVAHAAGRKVAFTLSESVCIAGRKEGFGQMIDSGGVDLLFANQDEALQLTGRADLGSALAELKSKVPTLVITRGPEGAIAIEDGQRISIPAAPVNEVVDTTGAGDLFAAGFLTARCKGATLERCLWTGAIAAAEVIQHYGARPMTDLKKLVKL